MDVGDSRTMRWRLASAIALAALLALVLLVSACGGGSTGNGTTEPTASAPAATTPPADATEPGTSSTQTPRPAREAPPIKQETSDGEDGARNVRVPARFVVRVQRLEPRTIRVPPFLAVKVTVRSGDGEQHRFALNTPEPQQLDIYPDRGERASMLVAGLRPGRYRIRVDFAYAGALVVGGEPGP